MFTLTLSEQALQTINHLKSDNSQKKRLKAIYKTLAYLEQNPRHPSLQTHKYHSLSGPNGAELFEAYVQNKTPAAYRIFWCYGPEKREITIVAITPHP